MKIKLAYLHSAITIPGIGATESTISAQKIRGGEFFYGQYADLKEDVLVLKVKGTVCIITQPNIKVMVPDDSVEVVPKSTVVGKKRSAHAEA